MMIEHFCVIHNETGMPLKICDAAHLCYLQPVERHYQFRTRVVVGPTFHSARAMKQA